MTDLFNPDRAALLDKWPSMLKTCRAISPWTSDAELAWLTEAASTRQTVGEVGSYKGKTAKALAWRCPGKVYCVDCFVDETFADCRSNLDEELRHEEVILFPLESAAGAATLRDQGIAFDLFFIDGAHDTPSVIRDIGLWLPLMKPGAILCGHDCFPQSGNGTGPNDVCQALMAALPDYTLVMDSIWAWQVPAPCSQPLLTP